MRGIIHKIHLWVGLALCVPLVLLGLTGSILVFQHELGDPHFAMASGDAHPISDLLATARTAAPEGFFPSMYRAPRPGAPAMIFLTRDGKQGKRIQMLIDPVSLAILDKDASGSLMRQLLQFHSSLLLRDYGGRSIVGWLGVTMLLFGFSGLVLWWPRPGRWRQAFTVKRGARRFRLHRDLHGAAGIWSSVVLLAMSFSGVYLAFPQTMGAAIGSVFPARDLRSMPGVTPLAGEIPMEIDAAIALAQQAAPPSRLFSVMLPAKPDQPYRIVMSQGSEGAPPLIFFVDPWAKVLVETRDPKDYSTGETIIAWQHSLHEGQGLGWLWRIMVFAAGFLPLLFAFTGISMWLIKRRQRGLRRQISPQSP